MKYLIGLLFFIPNFISAQVSFINQTKQFFPSDHFSGSVIGISDLNADGLDDILRLGDGRHMSIAIQRSPGTAYKIFSFGNQTPSQYWNAAIGDINHDGLNDIVMTPNENIATVYYGKKQNDSIFYIKAKLDSSENIYAQAGNLVDIDNDGWLDFFTCNDIGLNRIWANNKQGEIRNAPVNWIDFKTKIPSDNSGNYGSTWNDFDNDGDLDLYIAKCKAGVANPDDPRRINVYYRNNGNGSFSEIGTEIGIASGAQSWISVAADSDNDRDMDIFVLNHGSPSHLYINDGKGNFTDAFATSGINYNGIGSQAIWADINNDGLEDLVISGSNHQIYLNKGNNKFDILDSKILGINQIGSIAMGDLNNDGRLDVYASHTEQFNAASQRPDQVWINNTVNGNHFIKIRLEGVFSNRSGIGARISLHTKSKTQTREVQSGYGYGVHNSLIQHFGIGIETTIDSVVVRWPNGSKEKILTPFIDRTLLIKEKSCFAFDPIIQPIPNKSILCTAGDSVRLNSPITGNYSWSNGSNTREIIVKTTGHYQVNILNSEGCLLHSNTISIQSDPKSRYSILYSDTILCSNASTSLTIPSPFPLKWNTGDTSHSILVNKAGSFFATTQNECSSSQSDTISLRIINISNPVVKNDTIVLSGKATLRASGSGTFQWYNSLMGGSLLATGTSYLTGPIDKTTTFYVQSIVTEPGKKFSTGVKNHSGTVKTHSDNFSGKLFFDVNAPVQLKSVKVYTDTAATREIIILNNQGQLTHTKLLRIEKGESVINLNFNLLPGNGFAITTNDTTSFKIFGVRSPRLYRTEGTIPFPFIAGPIQIYGTNADTKNYFYFYDWQLLYPDINCPSERIPVQAVIRTVASKDINSEAISIFPNPVKKLLNIDLKNTSFQEAKLKLHLINMQGRILESKSTTSVQDRITWNIESLPSGIYNLKITSNKAEVYKKILILD